MKITIAQAKAIREQLRATHLVIFAISEDGTQHVATHGGTRVQAREAAKAGNKLKVALGWPDDLCHDKPLPRVCENCAYFKVDMGVFTCTGWTGGESGWCRLEPHHIKVGRRNTCQHFEP